MTLVALLILGFLIYNNPYKYFVASYGLSIIVLGILASTIYDTSASRPLEVVFFFVFGYALLTILEKYQEHQDKKEQILDMSRIKKEIAQRQDMAYNILRGLPLDQPKKMEDK